MIPSSSRSSNFAAGWGDAPERARRRMLRVEERLAATYGSPGLGNHLDPLNEAVYIILTYQTDVSRAQETFDALRDRFPRWADLASAQVEVVEDILRPSGLHRARARILRQLLQAVRVRFGDYDLSALRGLSRENAERELRALPGLDLKRARCVLLYSLGMKTLPVDSNTYRFMRRFGVLAAGSRFRRRVVHDGIEQLVPPKRRHSMHVNLVAHGQKTCLPTNPNCPSCPLRRTCPTGRSLSS